MNTLYGITLPNFGTGEFAYVAAKNWIFAKHPELNSQQIQQFHLLAAKMAGV